MAEPNPSVPSPVGAVNLVVASGSTFVLVVVVEEVVLLNLIHVLCWRVNESLS